MNKRVFVVTNAELGWDCIVGVFDPDCVTREQLEKRFNPEDSYFIFRLDIDESLAQHE